MKSSSSGSIQRTNYFLSGWQSTTKTLVLSWSSSRTSLQKARSFSKVSPVSVVSFDTKWRWSIYLGSRKSGPETMMILSDVCDMAAKAQIYS